MATTKKVGKKSSSTQKPTRPKVFCWLCGKSISKNSLNYHMRNIHDQAPAKDFNWGYYDFDGPRPKAISPTGAPKVNIVANKPVYISSETKTIKIPCIIEIPITIGEIKFTQE
jgi:hypothetical protein